MRKILFFSVALITAIALISCASTGTADDGFDHNYIVTMGLGQNKADCKPVDVYSDEQKIYIKFSENFKPSSSNLIIKQTGKGFGSLDDVSFKVNGNVISFPNTLGKRDAIQMKSGKIEAMIKHR